MEQTTAIEFDATTITPLGFGWTEEQIEDRLLLVTEGKIRDLKVMSTPARINRLETLSEEAAAKWSDDYSHSWLFALNGITAERMELLWQLYDEYATEDGLDYAFISKLLSKVTYHVNEGAADPELPLRGDAITVMFEERDGYLNAKSFLIQPAKAGGKVTRRKKGITG
jgi:DNA-binding transcriptional ArsR family regulator